MAMIFGEEKAAGFEKELFDEGIYDMRLVKVMAMKTKPTVHNPDGAHKLLMIWEWVDENGMPYKNDSDQSYELADMLGLPKNLKYNEKSGYWKRLSGISGFTINNDSIRRVGHDFGEFVQSFADILEIIDNPDPDKPEKLGKAVVKSIIVDGVEQLGRICKLVVKKTVDEKDKTKFYNNIESVMQIQVAGPRRPQPKAQAPAAQPPLVDAPRTQPPVRPSTTEPAHADLPY